MPVKAAVREDQTEDPSTFIEAMAAVATPVSIITTDGPAGRFGITVSAVASVSADPPMILACINRQSPAVAAIDINGVLCVNMLGAHQRALANCFAGRPDDGLPFDFSRATWQEAKTGAPLLSNATASFDCVLESAHDAGTHRVITGLVQQARSSSKQPPLAYSNRTYRTLRPLQQLSDSSDDSSMNGTIR